MSECVESEFWLTVKCRLRETKEQLHAAHDQKNPAHQHAVLSREDVLSRVLLLRSSQRLYHEQLRAWFNQWQWVLMVERVVWDLEAANAEEMEWQAPMMLAPAAHLCGR